jgi:hypothetical protein
MKFSRFVALTQKIRIKIANEYRAHMKKIRLKAENVFNVERNC